MRTATDRATAIWERRLAQGQARFRDGTITADELILIAAADPRLNEPVRAALRTARHYPYLRRAIRQQLSAAR